MLTAAGVILSVIIRNGTGFLWSLLFLPFVDVLTLVFW